MPEKATEYKVKSGEKNNLEIILPELYIRIPINPNLAESLDDKFKLTSADGKYKQDFTIKDDKFDGDDFVDLCFQNLKYSQKYTLEIDPGAEGSPYKVFEDLNYQNILDYYSELEEEDDLEGEEDEDDDDEKPPEMSDSEWEDDGDEDEFGGDAEDDDEEMIKIFEEKEEEQEDEDQRDNFDINNLTIEKLESEKE
jgi:hypothetical protein